MVAVAAAFVVVVVAAAAAVAVVVRSAIGAQGDDHRVGPVQAFAWKCAFSPDSR